MHLQQTPTFAELTQYRALLFDLDGVLTPTAELHEQAWADMFTAFLSSRNESSDIEPYTNQDYFDYLDGRRRDEAIAALLQSRGITLPYNRKEAGQSGEDSPQDDTIVGLGLRKNEDFLHLLEKGMDPYPGSAEFLKKIVEHNASLPEDEQIHLAVVSSSKNAPVVLKAAGLSHYFAHVVDGKLAEEKGLAGKPAPDTYVYGAELFDTTPEHAIVFEDATSGVAAGKAGNFGLVIGIDRGAGREALLKNGAGVVVNDLDELLG